MNERRDDELERALTAGRDPSDRELAALVDQAKLLRSEYRAELPAARHERALFVQGVVARGRATRPVRFLVPTTLLALALFAVALLGRSAVPGQTLYVVRGALATVGLAQSPSEEIDRRIENAQQNLDEADDLVGSDPGDAQDLVFGAIGDLDRAKAFLSDVSRSERNAYILTIDRLENRAAALIVSLDPKARSDADRKGREDEPGEDNSGPGGGDDDNSGPGGGDDDNSGPGGGDDDGDDAEDRLDEQRDREEDARDEQQDREEDLLDDRRDAEEDRSGSGGGSGDVDNSGSGSGDDD